MILPIVAYGDPVLKRRAAAVTDFTEVQELIDYMFETMYSAEGVGLAAPQVGHSLRIFVVDASPYGEDTDDPESLKVKDFKETFINAKMISSEGEEWPFAEGCLSIPGLREDVMRPPKIEMSYYDREGVFHERSFDGYAARIIQHEYDHIEGTLFTDKLSPLKKRMLKRKLSEISKGIVDVKYKMKFPNLSKSRV